MKSLKIGGIIFSALLLTTLGINASDVLNGNSGALLGQIIATQDRSCPEGMIEFAAGQTFSCIDVYEASASQECPEQSPANQSDTQKNINTVSCMPSSSRNSTPWTNISREQARTVCTRAGKRLPTAHEWYQIALGTPDTESSCNVSTEGAGMAGSYPQCISAVGVYDTIGSVWEWVSGDVIGGQYNGRALPVEGYVAQVASDGVATVSESVTVDDFSGDYIWTKSDGAYGILRGGFYGSREDAGIYSVQARTLPTAATKAIGFRCIQ